MSENVRVAIRNKIHDYTRELTSLASIFEEQHDQQIALFELRRIIQQLNSPNWNLIWCFDESVNAALREQWLDSVDLGTLGTPLYLENKSGVPVPVSLLEHCELARPSGDVPGHILLSRWEELATANPRLAGYLESTVNVCLWVFEGPPSQPRTIPDEVKPLINFVVGFDLQEAPDAAVESATEAVVPVASSAVSAAKARLEALKAKSASATLNRESSVVGGHALKYIAGLDGALLGVKHVKLDADANAIFFKKIIARESLLGMLVALNELNNVASYIRNRLRMEGVKLQQKIAYADAKIDLLRIRGRKSTHHEALVLLKEQLTEEIKRYQDYIKEKASGSETAKRVLFIDINNALSKLDENALVERRKASALSELNMGFIEKLGGSTNYEVFVHSSTSSSILSAIQERANNHFNAILKTRINGYVKRIENVNKLVEETSYDFRLDPQLKIKEHEFSVKDCIEQMLTYKIAPVLGNYEAAIERKGFLSRVGQARMVIGSFMMLALLVAGTFGARDHIKAVAPYSLAAIVLVVLFTFVTRPKEEKLKKCDMVEKFRDKVQTALVELMPKINTEVNNVVSTKIDDMLRTHLFRVNEYLSYLALETEEIKREISTQESQKRKFTEMHRLLTQKLAQIDGQIKGIKANQKEVIPTCDEILSQIGV